MGMDKILDELKSLRERQEKLWEEVKSLREDFSAMNRKLDTLGARWGIMSEAAFRETSREFWRRTLKLRLRIEKDL